MEHPGPVSDVESWWRNLLIGDDPAFNLRRTRHLFGRLPEGPRCKFCNAPFHGPGKPLTQLIGRSQSRISPQLCRLCEQTVTAHIGGAEVELTMLFADVRGSTSLAEEMSPTAFSQLINRFYIATTDELIKSQAWVDRLVGDQVIGMYLPGFAGRDHAKVALNAAKQLLTVTGHGSGLQPWIPVGIGVNTDAAFVGAVGSKGGATDITVLGDAANLTARLSSLAGPGEILLSKSTANLSNQTISGLEKRRLNVKGKSEAVEVYVKTLA